MPQNEGWYLFDGKQVAGPYTLDTIEKLRQSDPRSEKLLVSRKGYDQWYPIDHVATDTTAKLQAEIEQFKREVEKSAAALSGLEKPISKVQPQTISSKQARAEQPQTGRKNRKRKNKNKNKQKQQAPQPVTSSEPPKHFQPKTQPPVVLNVDPSMPQAHNYMLLKGRLRLGEIRTAGITAFVHWLFTAGIAPVLWYRSTVREIHWHTTSEIKRPNFLLALCFMIPIVACYSSFHIATELRRMEEQNQYRSVNPMIAAVLGVFPPFAVYYLQSAINDHWLLHVRSCT